MTDFVKSTAFSANEIDEIFSTAIKHGLKLKLHTEQFNSIGGLDVALKHKAVSVDHLEVVKDDDIPKLGRTDTVAVLLPGVSFFLNHTYHTSQKTDRDKMQLLHLLLIIIQVLPTFQV